MRLEDNEALDEFEYFGKRVNIGKDTDAGIGSIRKMHKKIF